MNKIEYRTIRSAAHANLAKRLNELAKEGWRVVCSYAEWSIILCREIKVPVKLIPLDMKPSDEGGLAQKEQKEE